MLGQRRMDLFFFWSENPPCQKKMHHKGHKKSHLPLGSTGKATLVLSIMCLTPFCNKIQTKFSVLIQLPKSYLCWIVSKNATSIRILCYSIVRQAQKIVCHSLCLSPPPPYILPSLTTIAVPVLEIAAEVTKACTVWKL